MNTAMKSVTMIAAGVAALAVSYSAFAQGAGAAASAGVYTDAQAGRGKAIYDAQCAACHGGTLAGADMSPPLAGGTFLANWSNQPLSELANRIRTTMPMDNPGTLSTAQTADVVAFILKSNGFKAGTTELPRNAQMMQQIKLDTPTGG